MTSTFNKVLNKIVIVHYGNIILYPPIITLIKTLLDKGYNVLVISGNTEFLESSILFNSNFSKIDISFNRSMNTLQRLKRRIFVGKKYKDELIKNYNHGDILWTTTDLTVRILNKTTLNCKHVMQLMELIEWMPLFDGAKVLKFNIEKYAKKAWKVVVPEQNRAYILKTWWGLNRVPYVLPNKPYSLKCEICDEDTKQAIEIISKESKKIILYLGIIGFDRDLTLYAEAVERLGDEYCLYILGDVKDQVKESFDQFLKKYKSVKYLGYYKAPQHLLFLRYAYIGLLPYSTAYNKGNANPLNVLYCAPNKIYEYAGFDVPMVGSNLLGLKEPFEKYHIGMCIEDNTSDAVVNAIKYVDRHHSKMKENCRSFYCSIKIEEIIDSIIEGEDV